MKVCRSYGKEKPDGYSSLSPDDYVRTTAIVTHATIKRTLEGAFPELSITQHDELFISVIEEIARLRGIARKGMKNEQALQTQQGPMSAQARSYARSALRKIHVNEVETLAERLDAAMRKIAEAFIEEIRK